MHYCLLIVLAILLPATPTFQAMMRSCSGKCRLNCPSGSMNCSMACSKGPCSIDCGIVPGCEQRCLENTECSHLQCLNPQECSQLCEGNCKKIYCKAGKCSQKSIGNTQLTCEAAHMCMQSSVKPAAAQKCNSKVCEQMCSGGGCDQFCQGEKCDQLCMDGKGCKQECKSGAKSCGQLCVNGGCEQQATADGHVFQNCSGGGCSMTAFGHSTNQGCLKGNCKIKAVAQKNASIRCEGETCDAHCNAPFCKIQCETEKWCKIDCRNAQQCEAFCVTGACRLDCSETSCMSHKVETLDSSGFIFSNSRAEGSQVHGKGALFLLSSLVCLVLAWMSQ